MNKRTSCKINGFKYPASDKISGRTSTICRSMACTLLKRDGCSPEEEAMWLKFFPQKTCAYCGKPASHLDHLHALIIDRKPTGYGTEAANLVPCCTECNQPKGNLDWEDYMRSSMCKHVGTTAEPDSQKAMELRIQNIKQFQIEMPPHKANFDSVTMKKWDEILFSFDEALKNAQNELLSLKKEIYK